MPRSEQIVVIAPRRSWLARHALDFILLEVALLVVVLAFLTNSLVGWIVGSLVLILLLLFLIPFGGRSILRRLSLGLAYVRRKPEPITNPDLPHDLVPLAQWVPGLAVSQTATVHGGEIGVIADGRAWTAVLALTSDDDLLADSYVELDLAGLDGLTIQDDFVFAGVQVVTYSVPCPTEVLLGPGSVAAAAYREISAEEPPPALRKTWLCLRLDPRRCLEAVVRRGTSIEGIHATLRFGLHRVQSALKRQGIETRALSPLEISEVLALTAGAGPEQVEQRTNEQWSSWTCDSLVHSGAMVRRWGSNPSVGYQRLLQSISTAPVLFAITSYTLSPTQGATGGIRVVTPTAAEARAAMTWVQQRLGSDVRLAPPGGTQVPTMLGTVPLGRGVTA